MCGPEPTEGGRKPALPTPELRAFTMGMRSYVTRMEEQGEHTVALLLRIGCDHFEAACDTYDCVEVAL